MCHFLKSGQMVIGNTNLIYKSMDGTARILDPNVFTKKYVENKGFAEQDVNIDTLLNSGVYRMRNNPGQPSDFDTKSGNLLTLRAEPTSRSLSQIIFDYPKDSNTRPLFGYRNIQTVENDPNSVLNVSPWNIVLSNQITVLPNNSNIITDINGCGLYCGRYLVNAPSNSWWYFLVFEYDNPTTSNIYRRYVAFDVFVTNGIYTVSYESKDATTENPFGNSTKTKQPNTWIPLVSWS